MKTTKNEPTIALFAE